MFSTWLDLQENFQPQFEKTMEFFQNKLIDDLKYDLEILSQKEFVGKKEHLAIIEDQLKSFGE